MKTVLQWVDVDQRKIDMKKLYIIALIIAIPFVILGVSHYHAIASTPEASEIPGDLIPHPEDTIFPGQEPPETDGWCPSSHPICGN